jgi:hypothetical protein
MPSRILKFPCPKCNRKNEVGSKFCNQCGASLPSAPRIISEGDADGRKSEHRDIAHPVTQHFREYLQSKILDAYKKEAEKNPSPGGSAGIDSEDNP